MPAALLFPPRDIYLMYSHEDSEAVRELYERLVQDGFRPFWDLETPLGVPVTATRQAAIEASKVLLVCLSEAAAERISQQSPRPVEEIEHSLARVDDLIRKTTTGPFSDLSLGNRLAAVQREYRELVARAIDGDAGAARLVGERGEELLHLTEGTPQGRIVADLVRAGAQSVRALSVPSKFEEAVVWAHRQRKLIVPIYLGNRFALPSRIEVLEQYKGFEFPDDFERLSAGLKDLISESFRLSVDAKPAAGMSLQLLSIALRNICCFESIDLALADDGADPALLSLVLGDNAAGKSTLLRSIALGLASESEASALIKALPGPFVRRGTDEGSIRLELCDPEDGRRLFITTRLSKNSGPDERVRKETDPELFPWENLFVCAYGTNRSRQATADYEAYSVRKAVLSLFDDGALLQNPEVILLRQESPLRRELERRLLSILMLDDPDYRLTCQHSGIEIRGPWGLHPLRTLSDGYRSTAHWVLDFLAWSLYAGRFGNGRDVGGILLVDELEQHLHPRWQRHLVQRLRQQFPKTQILASTHTPLVAAGAADVESARLFRLKEQAEGGPKVVDVDPDSLAGLRADQVLASEAFGLPTTRSPGSEDAVDRYTELLGKEKRTADEEAEMERLRTSLEAKLQTGETKAEREVEQALEQVLKERLATADPELLDVEVRRQLHQLFAGDEVD